MRQFLSVFVLLTFFITPAAFGQAQMPQRLADRAPTDIQTLPAVGKLAVHAAAGRISLLEQKQIELWDGEAWVLQSQDMLVYDGLRRAEERTFLWTGSAWENSTRTTYASNDAAQLVELREQWDPDRHAFVAVDQYRYEYTYAWPGGSGVVSSALYQVWEDDVWVDRDRTTYTIGHDGQPIMTGGLTETWDGGAWIPMERFSLHVEGNDVIQTDQLWSGDAWENDTRTIFHATSVADLQVQVAEFASLFTEYMGLGLASLQMPVHTSQTWDGDGWQDTDRMVHASYDFSTGQPDAIWYQESTANGWETVMRQAVSYRGIRQPLTITFATFEEYDWYAVLNEDYEYDAYDDLVRVTVQLPVVTEETYNLEDALRYAFRWEHVVSATEADEAPGGFALDPAYPNPFNPSTQLVYHVGTPGHVSLRVFDGLGRVVETLVDGHRDMGMHQITFDATALSGGIYLVRLEAAGRLHTRAITLVK